MKGFSGDKFFKQHIEELIIDHKINTVIETGTYKGDTSLGLSSMVPNVVTIEINDKYFHEAKENLLDRNNVTQLLGDAPDIIDRNMKSFRGPLLFFLDSHWYKNPLLAELQVIAKHGIKPIIIIHDMQNPNDPTMGYDSYPEQGIEYNWDYVKDAVEKIYGSDGYSKYYNKYATGSRRGILYILPK